MPKLRQELAVELADGRTLTAACDQRDYAALEASDIDESKPHTYGRHLAWTAARRAGQYTGSWEQFNTVDCVEVQVAGGPDPVGDGLDPTLQPPTAGSA